MRNLACLFSCAKEVCVIVNCFRAANPKSRVSIIRWRELKSLDTGTATQEAFKFWEIATFFAADIIVYNLCGFNLCYWWVAIDRGSICLLVFHGLCISLNALVQISEFKLLFCLSIRHKTSLNEIVTLELDTSETATILSLSIPFNDICANHIFDESCDRIRGIRKEILCFVKFQVTSLAKSAIRTIMACTIDELVFTFRLASTSFANFKTANFFTDSRSGCFYSLAFNHCHNTRN